MTTGDNAAPSRIDAVFAPDWRAGVPYQRMLADSLAAEGVEVSFLKDYRRGLPLTRGLNRHGHAGAILHLHWPEAYFPEFGWSWVRRWRHVPDLWLASRHRPLVLTAHNLYPHERRHQAGVRFAMRGSYRLARAVIAHSVAGAAAIAAEFGVPRERIHVVPHGDLAPDIGPLPAKPLARESLGLTTRPVCLAFGVVGPYKGLEELIDAWRRQSLPADLWIVGQPHTSGFGVEIRQRAAGLAGVQLVLERLSSTGLATWLAAADCVAFNYRHSLTSGAACLARSLGIPVLLPRRLASIDLDEPHSHVERFDAPETDFPAALARALRVPTDAAAAAAWREITAWPRIARATRAIYEQVLSPSPS